LFRYAKLLTVLALWDEHSSALSRCSAIWSGPLLIERVRSGMARARAEGRQIGRARLDVNREQVIADRRSGMSLTQVAKRHGISRASVCRLMKEASVPAFVGGMPEQASVAGAAQ
jgi:hypothetical protein